MLPRAADTKSRRRSSVEVTPHMMLALAIRQGQLEDVKKVYENDMKSQINLLNSADEDDDFFDCPIHVAAKCGFLDILAYIIDCKVDVNIRNLAGSTPAIFCSEFGHLGCLELIDRSKGDLEMPSYNGMTCLMKAALNDKLDCLKYLIGRGVSLNARSVNGETALFSSASFGRTRIVKALIDAKADFDLKDHVGWSPLSIAKENLQANTKECIAVLEAAGAKISHLRNFLSMISFSKTKL